jgi:prepilin-type N-terminal cleavage/methylation domain-containing protein
MKKNSIFLAGRFGFTLVELLVVIAIIGLLAGLAIPVMNKAFDSAANTQDLNNLRQIGTGIGQHQAEYGGRVPNVSVLIPGTGNSNRPDQASFMEGVDRMFPPDKQFSSGGIYNFQRRPIWFSKRYAKMPAGKQFDPNLQYYWGIAWGMNSYLYNNRDQFDGYLSRAPNLSRLVLVGEKHRGDGFGHDFNPTNRPTFERNVTNNYRVSRGSGGTNNMAYYLFADFHIESIAGDQSTQAHPEYNSWDPTNRLYYKWW